MGWDLAPAGLLCFPFHPVFIGGQKMDTEQAGKNRAQMSTSL